MNDYELKLLNNITIETITKGIIEETAKWKFKTADYISLVNALMDLSLTKSPTSPSKNILVEKSDLTELTLPLIGEQVQISLFDKNSDYDIVRKWLVDDIGRWFLLSRPDSRAMTLDQLLEDERNLLGLIRLHNSHPIGLMGYLEYDKHQRKAEMRKLIGEEDYREKGFAKEATILWMRYGLSNLGIKKIYLNTIENNIRNVTLNKELGFQIEGILRKECFIDNKYFDLLRMAFIVE
jgi:RimJ/RimL family protein N-acetyltransferase